MGSTFVLDLDSNPHPRMRAEAVRRRRRARWWRPLARRDWQVYLAAMADATGCAPSEIDAWVVRHT